jgi:undecaprenyl-diphosphatase
LVLWAAIAIIVTVVTTNTLARVLAWLPVAVMTWLVPLARVYRGMHYTTDVLAGLILGVAALAVGCFVARTWSAAADRRRRGDEDGRDATAVQGELAGAGR